MRKLCGIWFSLAALALFVPGLLANTPDSLIWHGSQNQVDAQIQKWPLPKLLKKIAAATGWQVYVEPGSKLDVSAKFSKLPPDEALRRLLGNLNYFKDETNGVARLFVFRTVSGAATQLVPPEKEKKDYRIPNELLVKLKHGSTNSIDELAKKVGAKVIGRDDKNGLYRLQFGDSSVTDAAAQEIASDPSVAAVGSNYTVDRPTPNQMGAAGATGPAFNLNPPAANGAIVGLVDTAVDPPDQFKKYMLPPISVVSQDDPPSDSPSHGTSMFETMLQAMSGDPSMVQPVTVFGNGESTSTYEVMEGIIAAVNAGANPINLSLGGTGNSPMLAELIDEATQKGVQLVAAAGNDAGTGDTYPAAYPGVLAVTASDPTGQLASYADDGNFVKAMADGTVLVLAKDGQTWMVQGTSPATAIITAEIAEGENQYHLTLPQATTRATQLNPPPLRTH